MDFLEQLLWKLKQRQFKGFPSQHDMSRFSDTHRGSGEIIRDPKLFNEAPNGPYISELDWRASTPPADHLSIDLYNAQNSVLQELMNRGGQMDAVSPLLGHGLDQYLNNFQMKQAMAKGSRHQKDIQNYGEWDTKSIPGYKYFNATPRIM